MAILVREVNPEDAASIIAYILHLIKEPGLDIVLNPGEFDLSVEQEQEILAAAATADNSIFLVAENDGKIIGLLNCKGGHRQAIHHTTELGITVDRDWRDQSVGAMLMQRAVDWARQGGVVKRIELKVFCRNERAIHLYQKFGFEIEGRRRMAVYREGEYHDGYIMALLL